MLSGPGRDEFLLGSEKIGIGVKKPAPAGLYSAMNRDSSSSIANKHCHHDEPNRKSIDHYFFGIYQRLKDSFRPQTPFSSVLVGTSGV
jgi:hypothetical protein